MQVETWVSPNGEDHAVPVVKDRGPILAPIILNCTTCGRKHDVGHARNVRAFEKMGKCVARQADWPYDCGAKRKYPDDIVYICDTHRVWWHETP